MHPISSISKEQSNCTIQKFAKMIITIQQQCSAISHFFSLPMNIKRTTIIKHETFKAIIQN